MSALLQLNGVSKSFAGVRAVNKVSLTLQPGEIVGLIGPNGAGKTTLVNLITGVFPPSEGSIVFDGRVISKIAPHRIAWRRYRAHVSSGAAVSRPVGIGQCRGGRDVLPASARRPSIRRVRSRMECLEFTGLAAIANSPGP